MPVDVGRVFELHIPIILLDITDLAALQRESHITLGDENPMYESIAHDSYKGYGARGKPAPIEQDTRRVNFSLGHDPPQFETDHHKHFTWKDPKTETDQEKERKQKIMDELRATHFSLGDDNPDYRSTMQDQFESAKSMNSQERAESLKGEHYLPTKGRIRIFWLDS